MYTKSATAAVTGARHVRAGRNGQDAAAAWVGDRCGAIVVCDGCGSGGSSEVGARLGARIAVAALADQLAAGTAPSDVWIVMRERLVAELTQLVAAMRGEREPIAGERSESAAPNGDAVRSIVYEHFLFTIVAAAWRGTEVCVWALGDGAYVLGDRVVVLGPFTDNQPPYVGYDLLGAPPRPHVEVADASCGFVAVATDGVAELTPELGLHAIAAKVDELVAHPDALRRRLALLARTSERVDWEARKIERRPASMQDDGAVAVLRWSGAYS